MNPTALAAYEQDLRDAIDAGDEDQMQALGLIIDEYDARPVASLHSSALWYASQGLRVFPLQAGSKIPLKGSKGCKMASTDPELIHLWWTGNPRANIGIATGNLVDVIDIDGYQGVQSYLQLEALPPVIGRVSTPRAGGSHLYVHAVEGRGNKAAMLPGVDYRGNGGYVVAPPSVTDAGMYRWIRPLTLNTKAAA